MKKIIVILLLFICFPFSVLAIDIESKSAIVVNRSNGEILFEKEKDLKLPIASLTKIMTTIVTLENVLDFDSLITVKNSDLYGLNGYQVIVLTNGMEVSIDDLLYSTIIYSAGDSAQVLANNVFGDYDKFIFKMNELAKKIGMINTNFSNAVGYDDNNYSTSYDLYKLIDYCLKNEKFYDIYTTKSYKMKVLDKKVVSYIDGLVSDLNLDNFDITFKGFKSGYTSKSGLSLSGISDIDGNELIIVTLGAMSGNELHDNVVDSINILRNIRDSYSNKVILDKNKLIDNITYKDGNKEINYEIRVQEDVKHYISDEIDLNYLKVFYEGKTVINNDIKEDDNIGNIKIYYEDKLVDSVDVKFNKRYLVKESKDYKNLLIFVGICLLGLVVFRKKK